ncbi:sigma-54-dependent Fis family transcriptional regulator [Confluentibacter flavum]|uniref:Fis family transcriptional regulator n=1 Tax=Confluentibacter flavum TaxID=1909700 RepID=A0A2N3HFQ1_9FLAO|nr:sigma 54-interacting transcriptional regulator [Confluentibacter flavum]PKQ43811.1 Fis family transcriptional regulator [Confluentibacter flavum]
MEKNKKVPGLIALKQIIEKTSDYTGKDFFKSLVQNLAEILDVHGVWVTEYWPELKKLNALAFWLKDDFVEHYEYLVTNTPCEPVLNSHDICHVPNNVINLYPKDPDLKALGAVSYMGLALRDTDGRVLGHLALLDNKPMPELPEVFAIFKIFASRAAAELRREIIQKKVVENESKLNRLVNGTSDGIIEFNSEFLITQTNEAAIQMFNFKESIVSKINLKSLFDLKSFYKLSTIIPQHKGLSNKHASLQIKDSLICLTTDRESFPCEVNLSSYTYNEELFFVLYIRNIKDQVSDKQKIKELHAEASMLKEKAIIEQFNYIIGDSQSIKNCLKLVSQVGPTDANVLILGETGTGKELFAKAVHEASRRVPKPMITLNCAALPSELIESELFGHVKGAFTGATISREGRFSLADQGTIFLDEIAELPLPLQAKLLRVIQEGTFEPVGSSETKNVDVRIIAATHRDLKRQVDDGKFREDLFYRLNVFPIHIPPLRKRDNDITLLAKAFFEKFSKNKAIQVMPLTKEDLVKLSAYHWPGNVRELQNIIERGIITNSDSRFNIDGLMPSTSIKNEVDKQTHKILTFDEMKAIEKENIIKALNITNWKISGPDGASKLLKIPRTTLTSKIKKLGIKHIAV